MTTTEKTEQPPVNAPLNIALSMGYTLPPLEVLEQIGKSAKITREFHYAHGVCDSFNNRVHFGALIYPNRYAVTKEQKEYATKHYNRMKTDILAGLGEKLVFVGMGVEYPARYDDDICNHRIRTEIVNPQGKRFFIEVGTWGSELMRFDHVIDRDQEEEYRCKSLEYRDKIEKAGGFWKIGKGHPLYDEYQKYQLQPYHWYKKNDWHDKRMKYTKANVLKMVNKLFECNFSELVIDCNFLTTDDFTSNSPKK
jgi:hypothetical protein